MNEDEYEPDPPSNNSGSGCGWLLFWIFIAGAVGIITLPRFLQTKYDGLTAEEWESEADYWQVRYLNLTDCVENYEYEDNYRELVNIRDCL